MAPLGSVWPPPMAHREHNLSSKFVSAQWSEVNLWPPHLCCTSVKCVPLTLETDSILEKVIWSVGGVGCIITGWWDWWIGSALTALIVPPSTLLNLLLQLPSLNIYKQNSAVAVFVHLRICCWLQTSCSWLGSPLSPSPNFTCACVSHFIYLFTDRTGSFPELKMNSWDLMSSERR